MIAACNASDEAVAAFDAALVANPRFAEAHGRRAVCLAALHRHDEALAAFRRALELKPDDPDTLGNLRNAIVFRLKPLDGSLGFTATEEDFGHAQVETGLVLEDTAKRTLAEVRTKQQLFRERLIGCEKGCRITGIEDLRFLRASHIKPWSKSTASERVDGQNGLLLAPHADHLFDRGWISFSNEGRLLVAGDLPPNVEESLKLNLKRGRRYGIFSAKQREYLDFHRDTVFEKHLNKGEGSPTTLY